MANTNTVFGARLVDSLSASLMNGKVHPYTVPATDAVALFVGDFVKLTGESANGEDGLNHPVVTQAAATELLVGFVAGFLVNPNYLTQLHRTANTLRTALVFDDHMGLFEIQSTGVGATGDIGQNADITVAAGSTITGLSGMQLDHATLAGADGQLRIVSLSNTVASEFGTYTKFTCLINEHSYKGTVGV